MKYILLLLYININIIIIMLVSLNIIIYKDQGDNNGYNIIIMSEYIILHLLLNY